MPHSIRAITHRAPRRLRPALLALAVSLLVFAQQGFVLHALSHLPSSPLAAASTTDGHDGKADACGLCLAFAALASGAPAPTLDFAAVRLEDDGVRGDPAPSVVATTAADYHSRAPPRLA